MPKVPEQVEMRVRMEWDAGDEDGGIEMQVMMEWMGMQVRMVKWMEMQVRR